MGGGARIRSSQNVYSAYIQLGHRGPVGLWGQQRRDYGLQPCGGCENLLTVGSAAISSSQHQSPHPHPQHKPVGCHARMQGQALVWWGVVGTQAVGAIANLINPAQILF